MLFFCIISAGGNIESPAFENFIAEPIPNSTPTRAPVDEPDLTINLISPSNDSNIHSPKVELSWAYDSEEITNVSFNVFFGEKSAPILYKRNYQKTSLVIDGLINNQKYYWQVKPWDNDYTYKLNPGGPWAFTVDVPASDLEDYFKVEISGDNWLYMAPGDKKVASLLIHNQGIYNDTFILSVNTHQTPLTSWSIESSKWVPKKTEVHENLVLHVSADAPYGSYKVSVTATSINSGEEVMDLHAMYISIQDDSSTNGALEESENTYRTSFNDIMYMCCIIFGIIFVVVFIPLLYKYKVKGSEQQKTVQRFPPPPPPPMQSQPPLPSTPPSKESKDVPLEFEIPAPPPEAKRSVLIEPRIEPVKPQQKKRRAKKKTSKSAPKPSTETISSIELAKLRIQHEELNEKLYALESEKAMEKVTMDEFEKRKGEIVKEFLEMSEE